MSFNIIFFVLNAKYLQNCGAFVLLAPPPHPDKSGPGSITTYVTPVRLWLIALRAPRRRDVFIQRWNIQ